MFRALLARIPPALDRVGGVCAVCHRWPAAPVCETCVSRFGAPRYRCATCAVALPQELTRCGACLTDPPPLDRCLCAVDYVWPWIGCIARFKFEDEPGWAPALVALLRSTPWVEPELEQADWLIPMPLSRGRLAERGYNQAMLLAQALDARRTRADLLLRIRETTPQSDLSRAERLRNLRGALALEPNQAESVRDRHVVLVDDVMTSGASLHAAARVLREAGARRIAALVVARTPAESH